MLRLRDIMTREVVTVSPDLLLRDAMDLFATRHISGAPVVRNDAVIGVVSLTDLAELAASSPGVPTERPELGEWGGFEEPQELPDEDLPPGAVFADMWDDAGADTVERMEETRGPEWNPLEDHSVSEAMSRTVVWLGPETPVDEAAAFMQRAGIHRVLIMDRERLVGLVSTMDISNAVAEHRLTLRSGRTAPHPAPIDVSAARDVGAAAPAR